MYSYIWDSLYIIQEPENLRIAPVIIFNFYLALLIDIIDNIITYSLYSRVLRHQNFGQWQCSILVTCIT